MKIISQTVFKILKFKKFCNLISGKYFGLYLENQILPEMHVFKKITKSIMGHH